MALVEDPELHDPVFTRLVEFKGALEDEQFVLSLMDAIMEFNNKRSATPIEALEDALNGVRSPSTLSTIMGVADPLFGRIIRFLIAQQSVLEVYN